MTTLIAVYNSEGLVGRCDAKRYEASHPNCQCVCGGKNHGAGKQQAMDNTRELADTWIKEYTELNGIEDYEAIVNRSVVNQMTLPI
jgi:hypothetical protein